MKWDISLLGCVCLVALIAYGCAAAETAQSGTPTSQRTTASRPQPQDSIEQKADDVVYHTLDMIDGTIRLKQGTLEDYKQQARDVFEKKYKNIESDKIGYTRFIDKFGEYGVRGDGLILRGHINGLINWYNRFTQLASALASTDLPDDFKTSHKNYYATQIIEKGLTGMYNVNDRVNIIQNIPSDSYFVRPKQGDTVDGVINNHYPNFNRLSEEQKVNVRRYIHSINSIYIYLGSWQGSSEDPINAVYRFDTQRTLRMPDADIIVAIPKPEFLDKVASGKK